MAEQKRPPTEVCFCVNPLRVLVHGEILSHGVESLPAVGKKIEPALF